MGKCISKSEKKPSVLSNSTSNDINECAEISHLAVIPEFNMNSNAADLIQSALSKNHLFRGLTQEHLSILISKVKFCVAKQGQTIFEQGSKGSLYFIVNSGKVQVLVDNKQKGILQSMDCFGEMALLSDSSRKATIKALTKTSFWILSRNTFLKAVKSVFKDGYDITRKQISNTLLFKDLSVKQLDLIARLSLKIEYHDQEVIIKEGDQGDLLHILTSGCVSFRKANKEYARIDKSGDIFGEGSLLTGERRRATCVSIGKTEVISINFGSLRDILGDSFDSLLLKNVAKNSILTDLNLKFLEKDKVFNICELLTWKKFKDQEIVMIKDEKYLKSLRVICTGAISWTEDNKHSIGAYQILGLRNENETNMPKGEYKAVNETIIGEVELVELDELLGIKSKDLIEKLDKIKLIKTVPFFQMLSEKSADFLAREMKLYDVIEGTKIFSIDDRSSKLYIVVSGIFETYDAKKRLIRIYKQHEVFGERCLYENKRTAEVVCKEEGKFYMISKSDIFHLDEIEEIVHEAKRKSYYHKNLTLDNIKLFKVTQEFRSDYGRKRFCLKDPVEKSKYDLVVIPKSSIENSRECVRLIKERDIMIQIEHRQLIKLVRSGIDNNNIYFITEHIKGVPLKSLLPVSDQISKLLTVHFINMIEYLHDKDIIYRDFCIDNIIVGQFGVPFLFNFKFAKVVNNRTYTRVGNPFIRSPEMILGRGYTKSTDIWSLGVVLFELINKKLPFELSLNDEPNLAYRKILNLHHGFDNSIDPAAKDLIEQMLCDSDSRIDINSLLNKNWFSSVDRSLTKRRLTNLPNMFGFKIKDSQKNKKTYSAEKIMTVITT